MATGDPIYVVHLDAENARVIVGPKEALDTRVLFLRDVNWLGDGPMSNIPASGMQLFVKVRSTRPPMEAILYPEDEEGRISVEIIGGEAGIANGQACVFYEDDTEDTRVLGGGFIASTLREASIEADLANILSSEAAA